MEHLVKDTTKEEIIGAIAEVLTDSGFIASPEEREGNNKSAPALASILQWHADHWDLMQVFPAPKDDARRAPSICRRYGRHT